MLSLLMTLLVIGAVAYFALRGSGGAHGAGEGGQLAAVNCERLASDLIQRTGGLGAAYQEAYAKLPPACQRMLPPPAGLALPPDPDK